jgi:4-hydroxybenzoate polyprenyltransferase
MMNNSEHNFTITPIGQFRDWVELLRIDRPIGYWLLMWPTLWGLLAASDGAPEFDHLVIFIAGVLLMRSAGCLINDFADRKLDPHVERTKQRPIAAGRITPTAALTGFVILLSIALLLVLRLPWFVIQLSVVGAILATLYPFMKRYIHVPQAWLGMSFGWGAIMAWAAEQGSINNSAVPWLLFAANVLWSISYDTAYALGDRADDKKMGMKSAALWFGDHAILAIILSGAGTVLLLGFACWRYDVIVQSAVMLTLCWQLWLSFMLFRHGESWGFQYFLKSHWTGLILCAGFSASAMLHDYSN